MGFFNGFSSRPKADSTPFQKHDSRADLCTSRRSFPTSVAPGFTGSHGGDVSGVAVEIEPREWRSGSGAAGDPAGIDVENLAGCAEPGECRGIGAGHPDLRAELRQLIEQRLAPGGIEMRHH